MIFRQLPLNLKNEPEIAPRIYHDTNDSMYHMKRAHKLYNFSGVEIPIFFQNYPFPETNILDEHSHLVKGEEIDKVDIISWKEYQQPELWWLICYVNNIDPYSLNDKDVLRILPLNYIFSDFIRYEFE